MWEWIFAALLLFVIFWLHMKQKIVKISVQNVSTKLLQSPNLDDLPMSYPQAAAELVNLGIPQSVVEQNKNIIESNIQTINELNAKSLEIKKADPNANPPQYGVTIATAYTESEFYKYNLGLKLNPNYFGQFTVQDIQIDPSKIRKFVKHTTESNLPIYNQGNCGCCWAVSASTVLNFHIFKKYPDIKSNQLFITNPLTYINCLSTDPSDRFTSNGCSGGDPLDVFNYTKGEKFVIAFQNNISNLTCPFPQINPPNPGPNQQPPPCNPPKQCGFIQSADPNSPTNRKLVLNVEPIVLFAERNSTAVIKGNDLLKIKYYLSTVGPCVICIDATQRGFNLYKPKPGVVSILDGEIVSNSSPDHAVVLSGYDVDTSGREYWIIQNSWDKSWGINGVCYSYIDKTGIAYIVGINVS